jgi:HlyD family secretion protein
VVALAAGAWLQKRTRGPAVEVTRPVLREVVQTVVSSGRVMAPTQVSLAAFVTGTVVEVLADEGQAVAAGQLLARLDDRELIAAERRAAALLARASAGALQVRRLSLPAARERVRQAELSLALARREFAQNEVLSHGGAVSPTVLDQARTQLGVAESQVEAARLQLDAATGRGSESLTAAATLEQARAELASARLSLERTRVTAPFSGVVLERAIEAGDSVQAGARFFTLSGVGGARLMIEPDERNLALLRVGQRARASAEAYPTQRFEAEVSYIAPSVDARRGTIEVRLDVAQAPEYLRPDMTVSVEIEVARKPGALVLPSTAVHELSSPQPWLLVLEGGRAVRRAIVTGIVGEAAIEIVRGLREGDMVILEAEGLRPGERAHARRGTP